jgi:hypothetical protein
MHILWLTARPWHAVVAHRVLTRRLCVPLSLVYRAALYACFAAIGSFIWLNFLTPLGRAIRWVVHMIGACFQAVGQAIWAVMAAIGHAIGAVLSAIYNGVLVPMGHAITSAGRAIKGLCA